MMRKIGLVELMYVRRKRNVGDIGIFQTAFETQLYATVSHRCTLSEAKVTEHNISNISILLKDKLNKRLLQEKSKPSHTSLQAKLT